MSLNADFTRGLSALEDGTRASQCEAMLPEHAGLCAAQGPHAPLSGDAA